MNKLPEESIARADSNAEGANPLVASAFIAGIVYVWTQAILRLLGTFNALPASFTLWQDRAGDIAAMWLTMAVLAGLVFVVLGRFVWRGRTSVGTYRLWLILLVVSAIVAPIVGEYGTPWAI